MEFIRLRDSCTSELKLLVAELNKLSETATLNIPEVQGSSVKIPLGGGWEVSLAIPLDANKYYPVTPRTAETLLFKDGNTSYPSEWGYDDVCRWDGDPRASTVDNAMVLEEIKRLKELVNSA